MVLRDIDYNISEKRGIFVADLISVSFHKDILKNSIKQLLNNEYRKN